MSHAHRLLLKWARTAHVYLTLFGLGLVLFFAVTGFLLNHEEWFGVEVTSTRTTTGTVPTGLLKEPDRLAVVELLRKDFGARGTVDAFEAEADSLRVVFAGPGRRDEAEIGRADGRVTVTHSSRGLLGLLTDLHRGKSTGRAWGAAHRRRVRAAAGRLGHRPGALVVAAQPRPARPGRPGAGPGRQRRGVLPVCAVAGLCTAARGCCTLSGCP